MRVLVTGDRNWTWKGIIQEQLHSLKEEDYFDPLVVVHGAARGADTLAGEAAATLGLLVEAHPARWEEHGRAAGPIRNREMLNSGIDLVLAFHSDLASSKGTKDMVFIANKEGVPVRLFADTRR